MKFKAYTGITWSLLELGGLLEDTDCRVCFEKVKKHFGLHPFHLTNIHTALNEILSSKLNSYDPELKGFLLAYKNPKLLTSLGEIFYDTCFIHVDVEADFYIFRPKVGSSLKGVVNKKGLNHIGLLVHKAFNISVPRPDGEDEWPGDTVEMGQEVKVHVTHLDYTSRLPFIRGLLDKEDYLEGCKLPSNSLENKRLSICEYDEDADVSSSQESAKKIKPRPFFTSDSEQSSEEEVETPAKRKQAKKEKQLIKNDTLSEEIEVEQKKSKNSKKVNRESKIDIPKQEELNNISIDTDNNCITDKIHEEVSTKKSKSKSKKSVEPVVNDTVPKLKKERVRTSSSSDNVLDEETYIRKIKKEKSSNVEKQSNISDANVSVQDSEVHSKSPSTKASKKKTKLSKAESEDVEIKDEQLVATEETTGHKKKRKKNKHNETKEEIAEAQLDISEEKLEAPSHSTDNHDVSINEDTDLVPKKKKSKKQKKLERDEELNNTSREEIVMSQVINSAVIDAQTKIPTPNIKTERLGSYDSTTEKKSKSKVSSEPVTIPNAAIMKIKKERSVSVSGSENATEDENTPRKEKSEKRSKSKKQYNITNDISVERSMENPDKRISKKMKMSESETESTSVAQLDNNEEKLEALSHSTDNHDVSINENTDLVPKKKKSKKQRKLEQDEELNNTSREEVVKSEVMNSTVIDAEPKIPTSNIKSERLGSYDSSTEKKSKSKGSPEPATIPNAVIMKIKKERSVSVSGSENATEDEKSPRKEKSEKRSKSKKQYDVANDVSVVGSMESPDKRILKKMKISESETESTSVPIKRETCPINNVTHSENSDASEINSQSSPKKKKSKKQKCIEEGNEAENNDYQNQIIKSEFMNSSGFSMTSEIPIIDIKEEKIQSADEMNENVCSSRSKASSTTNLEETAVSTENLSKKKKKRKNKDKDLSNDEILDASFEVMIKTEKPDSSSIIVKKEVKETPTKQKHIEEIEITVSEEEGDSERKKRKSKKVKAADASLSNNIDNEVAVSSNEDSKKKGGRKSSKSSHENANNIDYCNTKIKVEKDS